MTAAGEIELDALDAESAAALEWPELLRRLSRACLSAAGARRALGLQPAATLPLARERLKVTRELLELHELGASFQPRSFPDVSATIGHCARGGVVSASELAELSPLLEFARSLRMFVRTHEHGYPALCAELASDAELDELGNALGNALEVDGSVASHASPGLARARRSARDLRDEAKRKLGTLSERYRDLVQADYIAERDGRYVLPVRADAHLKVPGVILDSSASGATLYVEPEELIGLGNRVRAAEADAKREEAKVLRDLCTRVAEHAPALALAERACVNADWLGAVGQFARKARAITLPLEAEPRIELGDARHPLLALGEAPVVASDIAVEAGKALIISGPNAGGKTVALKTLGLIACMARAGLPVPVSPASKIGWFDCIRSDIGDEQSLSRSLSTFSAHVQKTASFLRAARPGALVLLDELAAGTDPEEGAALAAALLEAFTHAGAAVAVTTHYERLKELGAASRVLGNAAVGYDFERMAPTFRLRMGLAGASSALAVAERHGLPASVTTRAAQLLPERALERERAIKELARRKDELHELSRTLEVEREELTRERASVFAEAEAARIALQEEASRDVSALRQRVTRVRAELEAAREQLKLAPDLRRLTTVELGLSAAAAEVAIGGALTLAAEARPRSPTKVESFRAGERARVRSSGLEARVLESTGERVRVRVGGVKLTLRRDELELMAEPVLAAKSSGPKTKLVSVHAPDLRTPDNTIDLRGQRVDEGLALLDSFLDRLLGAGETHGFVLHGHGTGAMKVAVRKHLRASSHVERSAPSDSESGGDAFTTFWLAG